MTIFIAKYPDHFLTIAIFWSYPTQWPMQRCEFMVEQVKKLQRSVTPQIGHMPTLFTLFFVLTINGEDIL